MCNTYIVNEHVSYLNVSSVCGARLGADSAVFETCCQYEPRNETSHFGFKLEKLMFVEGLCAIRTGRKPCGPGVVSSRGFNTWELRIVMLLEYCGTV